MFLSGDPHADFDRWDRERERARDCHPKCVCCEEPILDDELFDFDGELVCCECKDGYINELFKKRTERYMED